MGDGVVDDTKTVQAALDAASKSGGACVRIPAGRYRIARSLHVPSSDRIDIVGDGASSVLLHEADEPLIAWGEHSSCRESSIRHLAFESVGKRKSPGTPVIACTGGAERSLFAHLLFKSGGAAMGSGVVVRNVMDTVTFDHCLLWGPVGGTGISVARGSQVLFFGGRILGSPDPYKTLSEGNIGIHLTGDNGGVHVVGMDIIGLGTGMMIGEAGHKSNREVFITHATFDSCVHGLMQVDGAYTSVAGCWSASCDQEQVLLEDSAEGAILSISGGTIFNGGTYGRPGDHNGLVVKNGTFTLSGVHVRHNKGTGVLVGPNVRDYAITGCRITDNGTGVVLDGSGYAFTGNVITRNGEQVVTRNSDYASVLGNVQH